MKINKNIILNLKIFTGCFFVIVFFYHIVRSVLFPIALSVEKFDNNNDSSPDLLRIYHNEKLYKELLDQSFSGVYDLRIFWNKDSSLNKMVRMLGRGKWFTEYYQAASYEKIGDIQLIKQELNSNKTFARLSEQEYTFFPFSRKIVYSIDNRIIYSVFYREGREHPFLVTLHDKSGRHERSFRDDNGDGKFDIVVYFKNGSVVRVSNCDLLAPLDLEKLNNYEFVEKYD